MIGINFDKDKVRHFVTCLAEGGPIDHDGGWSAEEMLMLGGACFFAVSSHGPMLQRMAKLMGEELPKPHPEYQEAEEHQFLADIHGATEFIAELTMRLHDGEYDEHFEPTVRALLRGDTKQVYPLKGFRKVG